MNFKKPRKEGDINLINLTPLVDVVLLLVLFFMVTAKFAVLPGLSLSLPEASPNQALETGERLEISLSAQGELFFNSEQIDLKKLKSRLAGESALAADTVVLISADEKASHGEVMKIMDLLAQKGFLRIIIATKNKPDNHD